MYKEGVKQLEKYKEEKDNLDPFLQVDSQGLKRIVDRKGQ